MKSCQKLGCVLFDSPPRTNVG